MAANAQPAHMPLSIVPHDGSLARRVRSFGPWANLAWPAGSGGPAGQPDVDLADDRRRSLGEGPLRGQLDQVGSRLGLRDVDRVAAGLFGDRRAGSLGHGALRR